MQYPMRSLIAGLIVLHSMHRFRHSSNLHIDKNARKSLKICCFSFFLMKLNTFLVRFTDGSKN